MTKTMNQSEEYTELFLRKIKNLTSTEENEMIMKLLSEDPALMKEFEELKVMAEAIKLYEYQKEAEAYFRKPVVRNINVFMWQTLSRAAVFILLIGGSFIAYLTFSGNYLPGINADAGVVRSTNSEFKPSPNILSRQEVAFEKFVLGQGYFSSKDFPKAIQLFEEAIKTPDLRNQVKEALEWHLCIAYLSNNQTEKADYWMTEIEKISEPKYQISWVNKLKVKWQILIKKTFS